MHFNFYCTTFCMNHFTKTGLDIHRCSGAKEYCIAKTKWLNWTFSKGVWGVMAPSKVIWSIFFH